MYMYIGWLWLVGLIKLQVSFAKISLYKRRYSAKETYNLIDPTDHSHPIIQYASRILIHIFIHTYIYIHIHICTYIIRFFSLKTEIEWGRVSEEEKRGETKREEKGGGERGRGGESVDTIQRERLYIYNLLHQPSCSRLPPHSR